MKKPPNPPKRCIFCEGGPISREHLYPVWMKEFLPADLVRTEHFVSERRVHSEFGTVPIQRYKNGKLSLTGDHRGRRLPVVCVSCNSGWMSNLQNKAKPILLPFLRGAWPSLTPQDQAILSKWAAMFTMVHEFADPTTAVIPISNRMSLQSSQVMPENWIVFIAPFGGIKQNGGAWHRSWRVFSSSESEKQTEIGGMQTTLFAAGQIFFQTFSSTQQVSDNFLKRFKQSARSLHLRKIWPIGLAGINGKKIRYRLNDDDFEIVMTTTTHLLNAKNPGRFE